MESLEITGKTVEEATQKALEQLGVTREEVEITVLKEGKSGILGLGAEEARISVRLLAGMPGEEKEKEVVEATKGVLGKLLTLMGLPGSIVSPAEAFVEEEEGGPAPIAFDIRGRDLGILIGRRGQTLTTLQYIVRLIVGHQTQTWVPIIIDVEGYRQRRYEALKTLAWRIAEQVKARGTPFTLEPMPAYERRIVHLTLAGNPDVTTQSTGEGEVRRVVVLPKEHKPDRQDVV